MFYFGWESLIPIPGVIFALYAKFKLEATYRKYHEIPQSQGKTGAEVAEAILEHAGIHDVRVEPCAGVLTDHYDPRNKVLRLSEENFQVSSLSSIGVAAHEAGHAIQHHQAYAPLQMRMAIVGVTNISSQAGIILFMIGLFTNIPAMLTIGIWLFSAIVVFQLITLPVEFDASARAKKVLGNMGFVNGEEGRAIQKVLGAAALTYVAGLAMAILELAKLIAIANSRRDR
jgi:uncharacterized protein